MFATQKQLELLFLHHKYKKGELPLEEHKHYRYLKKVHSPEVRERQLIQHSTDFYEKVFK